MESLPVDDSFGNPKTKKQGCTVSKVEWELRDKGGKRGKGKPGATGDDGVNDAVQDAEAGGHKKGGKKKEKKGRVVKVKMEDMYGGEKRSKPQKPLKAKDRFVEEYIRDHASESPCGTSSSSSSSSSSSATKDVGDGSAAEPDENPSSAVPTPQAPATVDSALSATDERRRRKGNALRAWAALPEEEKAERSSGDEAAAKAYHAAIADWEKKNVVRQEKLKAHRQR